MSIFFLSTSLGISPEPRDSGRDFLMGSKWLEMGIIFFSICSAKLLRIFDTSIILDNKILTLL